MFLSLILFSEVSLASVFVPRVSSNTDTGLNWVELTILCVYGHFFTLCEWESFFFFFDADFSTVCCAAVRSLKTSDLHDVLRRAAESAFGCTGGARAARFSSW